MKNPLIYLVFTKIKNWLKSLIKNPGRLIYFVIIIALLVFVGVSGNIDSEQPSEFRDIRELFAIITALYIFIFAFVANNGFSNGGSLFTMPDVNLIFTSPIKPSSALFYSLFQQLGTSALLGFFILFQYSWAHNLYGISYPVLILILLGYALTVFTAQFTAMIIYSVTNTSEKKKAVAKSVFYIIIGAFAAYVVFNAASDSSNLLPRAVEAMTSLPAKLFPVAGWTATLVYGIAEGAIADIIIGVSLCAVYLAFLICTVIFFNHDYYEDVIKTAEISQSAITARKQGALNDSSPKHVKVGKTGINRGFGASAIYYKHKLENRRSKLFILDTSSLIFVVCIIGFSFFFNSEGIAPVFMFATYMQIFSTALGRFNKELTKPFIYLIPESPVKKMIWGIAESIPSAIIEAMIVFIPVGFITKMTVPDVIFCIIARVSFSLLFTAGNIAMERIWGGSTLKMALTMIIYILIMIIMAAPGIALAVLASIMQPAFLPGNLSIFIPLILCNIPVSVLAMFLCRNMLQCAELNNK